MCEMSQLVLGGTSMANGHELTLLLHSTIGRRTLSLPLYYTLGYTAWGNLIQISVPLWRDTGAHIFHKWR